jgi:hypothetical protein
MSARRASHAAAAAVVTVLLSLVLAGPSAPQATGEARAANRLTVYLVRGAQLTPVRRVTPSTAAVARAALTSLLTGPSATERRAGIGSTIPAGTALRSVAVRGGVAEVDLSSRFETGGGSTSMLLRVAQVVYTLTQFPTIRRVAFRIDGARVEAIGGEGVIVAPPVDRDDFQSQAPPILVEQPLPGDTVGSRLVVRGSANVFEARLVIELRRTSGQLVERVRISASAGTGTRGAFVARLDIPATVARARVVVYANSPKNGRPIHRVAVAVSVS